MNEIKKYKQKDEILNDGLKSNISIFVTKNTNSFVIQQKITH